MNEPESPAPAIDDLLSRGIALARARRRAEARAALLQVLELDDRNETAWLWLSGVMDTLADRRTCLENVLAINPKNAAARRGLARLPAAPADPRIGSSTSGPTAAASISPAAAVLYPERQRPPPKLPEGPAPVGEPAPTVIPYQSSSTFDDVWSRTSDICAFCAFEVGAEDRRCPNCKRNLNARAFQYEKPTSNLYLYLTVLIGLTQALAFEALLTWLLPVPLTTRLVLTAYTAVLAAIAIGVAYRQGWAHATGTAALFLLLAGKALPIPWLSQWLTLDVTGIALTGNEAFLVSGFNLCAAPLQLGAALIGLLFSLILVRSDFARRTYRLLGRVDKKLREGSEFYLTGRRLAEQEMWAGAVLHWQRAVGQEPARLAYHRALGEGYARLGFPARARDSYRQARKLTKDEQLRAAFDAAIAELPPAETAAPPEHHPGQSSGK